jgi:hypothetical protein
MPNFNSIELAAVLGSAPQAQPDSAVVGGKVRRLRASFNLAAQANGDTLTLGKLPAGASFLMGLITSSVSLATSTLAIGVAGTAGKYRAAAVHTAADAPTPFGVAATKDDAPLAADETLIATIGTAALPGAGQLVIDILYTTRA